MMERPALDAIENPAQSCQKCRAQALSFALVPRSSFERIDLRLGADVQLVIWS